VQPFPVERLTDFGGQHSLEPLNCSASAFLCPKSRKTSRFPVHLKISLSSQHPQQL